MDYIAESKNIKISPRKVRLVAEGVKKLDIPVVISQLSVLNKRAAGPLKKTIESAIANAVHNGNVEKTNLMIKDILVNEGVKYKRYHFAARGRIRPYKKRTSHIRVILTEKTVKATEKPVEETKVEEPVKKEAKRGTKS